MRLSKPLGIDRRLPKIRKADGLSRGLGRRAHGSGVRAKRRRIYQSKGLCARQVKRGYNSRYSCHRIRSDGNHYFANGSHHILQAVWKGFSGIGPSWTRRRGYPRCCRSGSEDAAPSQGLVRLCGPDFATARIVAISLPWCGCYSSGCQVRLTSQKTPYIKPKMRYGAELISEGFAADLNGPTEGYETCSRHFHNPI